MKSIEGAAIFPEMNDVCLGTIVDKGAATGVDTTVVDGLCDVGVVTGELGTVTMGSCWSGEFV